MARSNPYKHKRRFAKTTLLVFGEGLGEEMFLKHLKSLYCFESGTAVTIRKGKGGTADAVVIDAAKAGDYDRKVVIIDNDKPPTEMDHARREAANRGIELIENTPCLEALLLTVLDLKNTPQGKTSAWYKSNFESKYIDKKKRSEPAEYTKRFPKSLLNESRKSLSTLDQLIKLME